MAAPVKDREELSDDRIRSEIAKLMAETAKLNTETAKLTKETRWYEVVIISGATLALVAIAKLFL